MSAILFTKSVSFRKIIVTGDSADPWYDDDGILTVNVYDFLLNPALLEG